MHAPASFEDAASRHLETTDLPNQLRWDPTGRTWRVRAGRTWNAIPTEVAITTVCRFLADDLASRHDQREPIPTVLSGVRNAAGGWPDLRFKVTHPAANRITRLCSGSAAFHGIPGVPSTAHVQAVRPEDRAPTDALMVWADAAIIAKPGTFTRRAAIVDAYLAAHEPGSASRVSISTALRTVLGPPSVRSGARGWYGIALAS